MNISEEMEDLANGKRIAGALAIVAIGPKRDFGMKIGNKAFSVDASGTLLSFFFDLQIQFSEHSAPVETAISSLPQNSFQKAEGENRLMPE